MCYKINLLLLEITLVLVTTLPHSYQYKRSSRNHVMMRNKLPQQYINLLLQITFSFQFLQIISFWDAWIRITSTTISCFKLSTCELHSEKFINRKKKKTEARERILFSSLYFSYGMRILSLDSSSGFVAYFLHHLLLVVWISRVWDWKCDGYLCEFKDVFSHSFSNEPLLDLRFYRD